MKIRCPKYVFENPLLKICFQKIHFGKHCLQKILLNQFSENTNIIDLWPFTFNPLLSSILLILIIKNADNQLSIICSFPKNYSPLVAAGTILFGDRKRRWADVAAPPIRPPPLPWAPVHASGAVREEGEEEEGEGEQQPALPQHHHCSLQVEQVIIINWCLLFISDDLVWIFTPCLSCAAVIPELIVNLTGEAVL